MLTSKDVAVESPSGHVTKALLAVHKQSHTHFSFFHFRCTANALLSQAKDKFFLKSVLSNVLSVLQDDEYNPGEGMREVSVSEALVQ